MNKLDLAKNYLKISSDLIEEDKSLYVYKESLNSIQSDYFNEIDAENDELEINREIINENEIVNKNKSKAIEKVIENHKLILPKTLPNKPQNKNINNYNLYLIILISVTIAIIGIILKFKKSKKDINIIKSQHENLKTFDSTNEIKIDIDNLKISKDKELEILKFLKTFEKGKQFTQKDFSLSSLSIILNTNTKYVNYILKKYRNESYPEYINRLRIEYVIERLNKQPELANYKIDHIARIGGYNSNTNFTQNFKKITNQLPSEYLENLRNKTEIG